MGLKLGNLKRGRVNIVWRKCLLIPNIGFLKNYIYSRGEKEFFAGGHEAVKEHDAGGFFYFLKGNPLSAIVAIA